MVLGRLAHAVDVARARKLAASFLPSLQGAKMLAVNSAKIIHPIHRCNHRTRVALSAGADSKPAAALVVLKVDSGASEAPILACKAGQRSLSTRCCRYTCKHRASRGLQKRALHGQLGKNSYTHERTSTLQQESVAGAILFRMSK
jgi:hypothetical protein